MTFSVTCQTLAGAIGCQGLWMLCLKGFQVARPTRLRCEDTRPDQGAVFSLCPTRTPQHPVEVPERPLKTEAGLVARSVSNQTFPTAPSIALIGLHAAFSPTANTANVTSFIG